LRATARLPCADSPREDGSQACRGAHRLHTTPSSILSENLSETLSAVEGSAAEGSGAEGQFLPDDFSYHINILNSVYDDRGTPAGQPDSRWNGNAQHVVRILDDYHYVIEVSVPWAEIGVEPVEGHTILGIDFAVNGKDPDTGAYDYFDWCGLKVFHEPSGFGKLLLAGRRSE